MVKRLVLNFVLFLVFIFPRPGQAQEPEKSVQTGLFVSVIQEPPVLSSRSSVTDLIEFARRSGIKTLFVQIYYANKAWFPSKVGNSTPYETALRDVGEDPFALLIREAHTSGIEVHAWLNMLSLSGNENALLLKRYGASILTKDKLEKSSLRDYRIDNQYFLEPGDPRVREELAGIVTEVVTAYPELDGVQFDYIRYPDVHPVYGYTDANIARYRKATGARTVEEGSRSWQDWRRNQVTELVELLAGKARSLHPGILVSVTGCMPYARAYHEAFQDWPAWIDSGLVDFATIMNYSPDAATFERWIVGARRMTRDFGKVNIAVGAYRLTGMPETFNEELKICEKAGGGACVAFHYGSLLENPALQIPLASRTATGKTAAKQD